MLLSTHHGEVERSPGFRILYDTEQIKHQKYGYNITEKRNLIPDKTFSEFHTLNIILYSVFIKRVIFQFRLYHKT